MAEGGDTRPSRPYLNPFHSELVHTFISINTSRDLLCYIRDFQSSLLPVCVEAMALHWLYLAVLSTWLASSLSNGSCPSLSGQRQHLYYSPKDFLDFTGTIGAHKLSCADGYVLDGPSDVECIKGVWRPWLPECRGDLQSCNHCSFELSRTRCSSVLVVYKLYKILPFQDEVL